MTAFLEDNYAQQPFFVDDADVTEEGKFNVEFSNEFDKLPSATLPVKYQNTTRATLSYGLFKNAEISVSGQFLTLAGGTERTRFVGGIGDTSFAVKYNFYQEREHSCLPAFTVSAAIKIPTGNTERDIGSGTIDFGVNGIAQKTFKAKNTVRVNAGYIFAGSALTGALGISSVRGHVFTGGTSYVRKFNAKLQLGGEVVGAVSNNFQLNKSQLQTQFGGNYQLKKNMTLDFGLIAGRFAASPSLGFIFGASVDF